MKTGGKSTMNFKYTRIYAGPDGNTHFQDVEVLMTSEQGDQFKSILVKATGILFRITGPGHDLDWHPVSRKQFVITLEGEGDVVASDGTTRRFGPGDIMLADDMNSKGHLSKAVGGKPRKSIFVTVD
jgi:uncharacterized cupin superfamily protein